MNANISCSLEGWYYLSNMETKQFSPLMLLFNQTLTRLLRSLKPSAMKGASFLTEQENAFNNNKTIACSGIPQRRDFHLMYD